MTFCNSYKYVKLIIFPFQDAENDTFICNNGIILLTKQQLFTTLHQEFYNS